MDEQVVKLLSQILDELKSINKKIDTITENGAYSLHDVSSRIEDVERALHGASEGVDNIINLISKS